MKVLFVDEKNTWHKFFDLVLSLRGVEVLHANTVKEALNVAFSEKPDVAIVDVSVYNASGYEVIPKLVEVGIPVIFIGYEKEGFNKEKALSLGALEAIKRPFTVEDLIEALRRAKKEELKPQELQLVLPEETQTTEEEEIPTVSVPEETVGESNVPVIPVEEKVSEVQPEPVTAEVKPLEETETEEIPKEAFEEKNVPVVPAGEEVSETQPKSLTVGSEAEEKVTPSEKPGFQGVLEKPENLVSKEEVEKIIKEVVWEVVPEIAEKVIREEVEKLIRSRLA